MAVRKNFVDAAKAKEATTYFNSEYGFTKKTGMGLGVEAYIILLGLDQGIYETRKHSVKSRKVNGQENGFRGKFGTNIVCRGYDDEGNRIEGAVCCQLAQEEKDRIPDKEKSGQRMISFMGTTVHIPVLILGNSEKDTKVKKIPPHKLSLNSYDFSYLELSQSAFQTNFISDLATELKNNGTIEYELEGEELYAELMKHLSNTIVKVTGVASDKVKYERSYSFIPFTMAAIGKATDEYEAITNYTKNKAVMNDCIDFMALFDSKVDSLIVADWTDDALIKYVTEDTKRISNVENCVKDMDAEAEEEVLLREVEEVNVTEEATTAEAELANSLTEEDFSLDSEDDDFFGDEED